MRPKKALGQCFLVNRRAAARIASLLQLQPGERVVEIGGGRGELTQHLLETQAEVYVLEIDPQLADLLQRKFAALQNFHLLRQDILKLQPATLTTGVCELKLVGNIPYNLSAPIIEWFIEHRSCFRQVVLTLQKEVGERVAAAPGGKQFGSLTVYVQLFYTVTRVFDLKPGSFFPPPGVTSTVVHLQRRQVDLVAEEEFADLRRLTSACFRWRRKQIVRILREEYGLEAAAAQQVLRNLTIADSARPEQLAVADFVALARELGCILSD
jgi:16S rRNA (adenine1518-N6/adenine1519-N6)-dimethyltransferase